MMIPLSTSTMMRRVQSSTTLLVLQLFLAVGLLSSFATLCTAAVPTPRPTRKPTRIPTRKPTRTPTRIPTPIPTRKPTRKPTCKPTTTTETPNEPLPGDPCIPSPDLTACVTAPGYTTDCSPGCQVVTSQLRFLACAFIHSSTVARVLVGTSTEVLEQDCGCCDD